MAWVDNWTANNIVLQNAEKMLREVHVDEDLVAKLHSFNEEHGVVGIMPPMEQLREAGLDDVTTHIDELGGVMSACRVLKLLFAIPRSRDGFISMLHPWNGDTRKVELTEELSARLDLIRASQEYQRRRQCVNLGSDLFLEDLKIAARAKARAEAHSGEGGGAAEGASGAGASGAGPGGAGASAAEGASAGGASAEEGKKGKKRKSDGGGAQELQQNKSPKKKGSKDKKASRLR
ncbi:hypothetical protein T484DRAFT_1893861 [Baffinella frigidus]|nr:hypothetical protein T484DRAFT_1893861 [Cryptophyta sp. CCMP2293]